jgi:hypothetical protein
MLRVQLGRGDQARRGRDEARPAEAAARARVFQRGTVQEPVEVTGQELSMCPFACVFVNHSVLITHPASRCIISCQRLDFDSPSCDCGPPSCPSHISSVPNFGSLPYRQPLKSPCFRLAGSSRRVLLVHVLRRVAGRGLVQVLDVGGRSPRLRAHTMMQATNDSIDSSGASARACGRTSQ